MGASRRAWRAIERAQMKDAAKQVRATKRLERAEAEAMQADAMSMVEGFESGLVRDPKTGEPVYAAATELADRGE